MTELWDKRFAELFPDDVVQQIIEIIQHIDASTAGDNITTQELIADLVADEYDRLFGV